MAFFLLKSLLFFWLLFQKLALLFRCSSCFLLGYLDGVGTSSALFGTLSLKHHPFLVGVRSFFATVDLAFICLQHILFDRGLIVSALTELSGRDMHSLLIRS